MPTLQDLRRDLHSFEALLDRCERVHVHGLPFDDLRTLGRLYRLHATRLAQQRERDDDPAVIRHLNALCVRAYGLLYAAAPPAAGPPRALLAQLPQVLARTWRVQVVAWALLLAGILMGGALAWRQPDAVFALVPASLGYSGERLDRLLASPEARASFLAHAEGSASWRAVFSSYLFTHNTRVGLLAFAMGMLAGVPTVLLQLYNGILLGAFATIFLRDPWPLPFFGWILPHAIPELTAITLCAAGGLLLGEAVAVPGRRGRRHALREAINPALVLVAAAVPLLALAALVESFVRESALGTAPRLAIAGCMLLALLAALAAVRRLARRYHVDTGWLQEVSALAHSGSPGSDSAPPP